MSFILKATNDTQYQGIVLVLPAGYLVKNVRICVLKHYYEASQVLCERSYEYFV
jgi:hypothetical protein